MPALREHVTAIQRRIGQHAGKEMIKAGSRVEDAYQVVGKSTELADLTLDPDVRAKKSQLEMLSAFYLKQLKPSEKALELKQIDKAYTNLNRVYDIVGIPIVDLKKELMTFYDNCIEITKLKIEALRLRKIIAKPVSTIKQQKHQREAISRFTAIAKEIEVLMAQNGFFTDEKLDKMEKMRESEERTLTITLQEDLSRTADIVKKMEVIGEKLDKIVKEIKSKENTLTIDIEPEPEDKVETTTESRASIEPDANPRGSDFEEQLRSAGALGLFGEASNTGIESKANPDITQKTASAEQPRQ